jgi:hypothetical protein
VKARKRSIPIWLVFAAGAIVWLGLGFFQDGVIPFWRDATYSDLLITHLPNSLFLRRALTTWGQVPLWNPLILSGQPFAADPLSGLWYPPNWLAVVLSPEAAFPLLFWFHLTLAGFGTWQLARSEGVRRIGSIIAGLAFMGTPKFIAHVGLGHIGLVSAVSWMPWALLLARKTLEDIPSSDRKWMMYAALAGSILGLIFLADPRWSLPSAILVFVYVVFTTLGMERDKTSRKRFLYAGGITILFAALIAAVLAIPMVEFSIQSTRWNLSGPEQEMLAMPLAGLFNLLTPTLMQPEWFIFLGITVLYLACSVFIRPGRYSWFWFSIALFTVILSLGSATPFYAIFNFLIPGASMLRVPPRWIFVGWFGMAMLAGYGINAIQKYRNDEGVKRKMRLFTMGFFTFLFLFVGGSWLMGSNPTQLQTISLVLALIVFIWGIMSYSGKLSENVLIAGWIILLVVELTWVNHNLLEHRELAALEAEKEALVSVISPGDTEGRYFSPSYSLPQNIAAEHGLELADGVTPLQLRDYYQYMAEAVGYSGEGYSVTLPPFPTGDPTDPWGFTPNSDDLGKLSVRTVLSAYPVDASGLVFVDNINGVYVYEVAEARPRAWVEEESGEWKFVKELRWTPNRIEIEAEGPGVLVLSEIQYPGWNASIDSQSAHIISSDGIFRAVPLTEGTHNVVFEFQPLTVFIGLLCTFAAIAGLIWLWFRR